MLKATTHHQPWIDVRVLFCLIALCFSFTGCQSDKRNMDFGKSIFGTYAEAKERMGEYQHVILVDVQQTRGEDQGPNKYGLLHFNGTVIKTYKGKWSAGEHIAFVHGVDYRVSNTTNSNLNGKFFVFANAHQSSEFSIETGDFLSYDAELDHQLKILFP